MPASGKHPQWNQKFLKNHIDNFNSIEDAYQYILNINKIYFNNFYTEDSIESITLNKDEKKNINSKIIFNLKNNNFIDLLLYHNIESNESYECNHFWINKKKGKQTYSLLFNN